MEKSPECSKSPLKPSLIGVSLRRDVTEILHKLDLETVGVDKIDQVATVRDAGPLFYLERRRGQIKCAERLAADAAPSGADVALPEEVLS